METSRNLRAVVLLAGAALLPVGAMALPPAGEAVRSEAVRYKPSAASTAEGAKKLYRQLETVALRVCSLERGAMPPYYVDRECVDKALDKAVADVGSTYLTAVRLKHGGNKVAAAMPVSPEAGTVASR